MWSTGYLGGSVIESAAVAISGSLDDDKDNDSTTEDNSTSIIYFQCGSIIHWGRGEINKLCFWKKPLTIHFNPSLLSQPGKL